MGTSLFVGVHEFVIRKCAHCCL